MKIKMLFPILLACVACKDYLNLVPKNEQVVSNVEDVRTELLTFWTGHCRANTLLTPAYGQSVLSLPLYNDVNCQLAIYEDNLNLLYFNEHSSINTGWMNCYWECVDWKGRSLASTIWKNGYASIGFMNAILDDLAKVPHTREEAETIGGEAKVIRAWNILKLLQFFAPYGNGRLGLPLNLNSENMTPSDRLTQAEVYEVVERELLEVSEYTTPRKDWNFFYSSAFVRSMLAELYLFRAGSAAAKESDWADAERYSAGLIDSYEPEETPEVLRAMFAADRVSYEVNGSLYALKLSTRRFTAIGSEYYTGIWGLNNAQLPSDELWNLYEPEDIRRQAWFTETENEGQTLYYVTKPVTATWGPVGDIMVFYRKADLYLMNVEAKCHLGREGEAAEMLKAFREVRIPGTVQMVEGDVLEELRKERRREFCYENGSRWLDMKRWGVRSTRMGYDQATGAARLYTLEADDYRYALPIPYDIELDYNNISQNPGWTNYDL